MIRRIRVCPLWLALSAVGVLLGGRDGACLAQDKSEAKDQEKKAAADPGTQSSPEALSRYTDAANFQNNSAFDLAVEEWARFLERFPNDPLAPKAQHYLGVCQMQLKQFAKAAASFQQVVSKYPKFDQLDETYRNLGWCLYSLGAAGDAAQYPRAVEVYEKLISDYAKGKFIDEALFFEGESLYAMGKRKEAALAYGRLVTGHPESKLRPDALYALGVTLEEMSEWVQAAKAYDMFLAECGTSDLLTEVRMRKAETLLQQGDVAQAGALFGEVAAVDGFESADHALMRQAFCATRQDKLAEAAALYASLTERFPKSASVPDAQLSAGRCFYRLAKFDDAAAWFDKAVAAGGDGAVEAAHWLCRIRLQAKHPELALQLVDTILPQAGASPFAPNLKVDRADALYEIEGRRADALNEYLAAYKAHPDHEVAALALYNAAFAALELSQYDQALELANQFLKAYDKNTLAPDAQYIVAECQIQKKDHAQAEKLYRALLDSAAEHPEKNLWQIRLGLTIYLQKKYQEVIDRLMPLVPQLASPDQKAEACYLIGLSQYQLGQFNEAATQLQAALAASSAWRQADETLLYLARAQRKLGQVDQAIATLNTLLKDHAATTVADQVYYDLGEYQYAADHYAEAIAAYDQVIQQHAQSTYVPYALYGQGWAALKSGQYDVAVKSFSALMDKFAQHPLRTDALLARGMSYRQQQKFAEAIADIDQYLAASPQGGQRADALYERGAAEAAQGEPAKAVATLTTLLTEQPDYAGADKALYELGWACRSQNDEAGATKAFAELVAKHATSPLAAEASFHVAESHYAKKEYAEAAKLYEQAVQTTNADLAEKVHYKLGWAHYQLGHYQPSLEQFQAQLAANPDGKLASDAWFMKGECLFRLQDYAQALPALIEAGRRGDSSPQIAVLRQLHAGQAALQLDKASESVAFFDALIEKNPESSYLAEAHFERGRARQKLNQIAEAVADFKEAAERSRDVVGARAQFMLGEIGFQQKHFDDAIKDYQRVMFRYGTEQVPPAIKSWQAKAGFEAGRCCDVMIESATSPAERSVRIADAKKFYRYVVETHPDNELAAQAKKRLEALAQL